MITNSNPLTTANARITRLETLLRESKREHYHCADSWYCCAKCDHEDHGGEPLDGHAGEWPRVKGVCNCGADEWNRRVEEVLCEAL